MQDALKDLQNEFSEIHDSFMVSSAAVRSGSQIWRQSLHCAFATVTIAIYTASRLALSVLCVG